MRLFARPQKRKARRNRPEQEAAGQSGQGAQQKLSRQLESNIEQIQTLFGNAADLVVRQFSFGKKENAVKAALVFLDGMVKTEVINDDIIKSLMLDSRPFDPLSGEDMQDVAGMNEVRDRLLTVGEVKMISTLGDVAQACMGGNAVLLAQGFAAALDIGAKGWDKRSISEPTSETAVRGPREGFTENLRTNTTLIRRRIKDPALRIRAADVGKRTKTQINILYIEGLADPQLVQEIEERIKKIDTDAILATGYLEQYIEDAPGSAFPIIWCSERPDAVAGKILEGRVAVVVDGTPFVMTAPMLFIENFQSTEDYITRSYYASTMRILRMISFFISLFAPALYIALSSFHQELIPTTLLFTMAASSEGTPFPAVVELGLMMLIFEILREAGVRMPRSVGQTISIVGALVMGEAAVQAGLVGAPVVIVIAITAVSSFAIPFAADALAILRWFLLIMASLMGSFGVTIGGFVILVHLTSLRSFGTKYMAPIAPFQIPDLKDTFVRLPLWAMRTRPRALKPQDLQRQGDNGPKANAQEGEGGE